MKKTGLGTAKCRDSGRSNSKGVRDYTCTVKGQKGETGFKYM